MNAAAANVTISAVECPVDEKPLRTGGANLRLGGLIGLEDSTPNLPEYPTRWTYFRSVTTIGTHGHQPDCRAQSANSSDPGITRHRTNAV